MIMKVFNKNRKGFSLVELIVVIAIMAVLAGVVGGTLFSQKNKSEDNIAETEALNVLQNCRNIYILWRNGHGSSETFTIEYLRAELNDLFQDENEFVLTRQGPQTHISIWWNCVMTQQQANLDTLTYRLNQNVLVKPQ
jgi:prepilin-type N-terminal cleavage/methylation domain